MNKNQNGPATTKINFDQIEEICDEIDAELMTREKLLDFVQYDSFYDLLANPWNEPKKLAKVLRIIVATKKYFTERQETLEVFDKVLKSNLLKTIITKNLPLLKQSNKSQTRIFAILFHYVIVTLQHGYEDHLTKMENYDADVYQLFTALKPICNDVLLEMTLPLLTELEETYTGLQKIKAEQIRKKAASQFTNRKFTGHQSTPNENFRDLSIIPTPDELNIEHKPYLRSAKIFEPYFDREHYLDVHFRLLREDLISPLRSGIAEMRTGKAKLRCYKNVKIDGISLHLISGEYIYYIKIDDSQIRLCQKTLKNSCLLCLSSDKYKNEFLFASVMDRDDCILEGKIGIKFEDEYQMDASKEYEMVESPAYFEAYRHVLTALQNIDPAEPLPFENYLVHGQTETELPEYTDGTTLYDFSCILTKEAEEELSTVRYTVSELKEIPAENFILNESQFNAFTYALESELALIQGPPGTGKSFIGLQLAKFLLHHNNWEKWNHLESPLLIVCYTNHALDQFLEGIYDLFENNIVRVGSRSKNRVLQQFMMNQWRRVFGDKSHRLLNKYLRDLGCEIMKNRNHLKQLNNGLASFEAMLFIPGSGSLSKSSYIYWLTSFKNDDKYELDAQVIRKLVKKGASEEMAREAYASFCSKRKKDEDMIVNVNDLYKQITAKHFFRGMFEARTSQWPWLVDIDKVVKIGYSEKVAIKLLQNANMKVEVIEEEFRNHPFKIREKFDFDDNDEIEDVADEDEIEEIIEEEEAEDETAATSNNEKTEIKKSRNKRNQEWKFPSDVEMFSEFIKSAPAMNESEKDEITDIWKIPLQTRWRLYQRWILEATELTKTALVNSEQEYYQYKSQVNELNKDLDKIILHSAKIIGMTTTGAAKYQSYLEELKPCIVIAEEAAEVLEAHIFTSLTSSCQHLILIGDHQQLRPNISEYKLTDYRFDVSLFERLVKNGNNHKMLTTQHRMRPEISSIMRKNFYEDLLDDESVMERPNVKGVKKDIMFIKHSYPEIYNAELESRMNTYEMHYALSLAKYFLQQGYKQRQITILCTYSDQRYNLRRVSRKMIDEKHEIRIENVDNYQGEESDIIILSLVRSESDNGKVGYLNTKNRVCVALSRARIGMYVIGNIEYLASAATSKLWSDIKETVESEELNCLSEHFVTKCQKHGTEQIIKNWKDFESKCPEGGCQVECLEKLECGHFCPKACHGYDMAHKGFLCEKPCKRKCFLQGAQPCQKLCYQECDPCEFHEDGSCYYAAVVEEVVISNEDSPDEEEKCENSGRDSDISFFLTGNCPSKK